MLLPEKSCCAFLHFSENDEIPYYVQIYCNELSKYFDEIVLVSNTKNLNLNKSFSTNVRLWHTENKGYDFGMFYRFLNSINLSEYKTIACINDSNILINTLDGVFKWGNAQDVDMWGIIDSIEKPWFSTHENNYHLQSHFIVLNKKAIECLKNYLKTLNIEQIMGIMDKKELRRQVINDWEIGLSQFFIQQKLSLDSFIDSAKILSKYESKKKNICHSLFSELIEYENYPLLKKKLITKKKKWFIFNSINWKKLVLEKTNKEWDAKSLIQEFE